MLTNKQLLSLLVAGTLFLLIAPLFVILSGWEWAPFTEEPNYLYPLYLVTETGTVPQVLITCLLFACIPLIYLKLPLKQTCLCFVVIVLYLGAGQIVKGAMKNTFQESRPYVTWLGTENYMAQDDFYSLSRHQRKSFVLKQDFSQYNIPKWLQAHWAKETGFSFPSGHTIYAAQWLLIYLVLLWRKKAYIPISLMAVYALCMLSSRMVLGMHWAGDVLVSCLLAPLLFYPVYYLGWRKWCHV